MWFRILRIGKCGQWLTCSNQGIEVFPFMQSLIGPIQTQRTTAKVTQNDDRVSVSIPTSTVKKKVATLTIFEKLYFEKR